MSKLLLKQTVKTCKPHQCADSNKRPPRRMVCSQRRNVSRAPVLQQLAISGHEKTPTTCLCCRHSMQQISPRANLALPRTTSRERTHNVILMRSERRAIRYKRIVAHTHTALPGLLQVPVNYRGINNERQKLALSVNYQVENFGEVVCVKGRTRRVNESRPHRFIRINRLTWSMLPSQSDEKHSSIAHVLPVWNFSNAQDTILILVNPSGENPRNAGNGSFRSSWRN
jgi:hypothetical protein